MKPMRRSFNLASFVLMRDRGAGAAAVAKPALLKNARAKRSGQTKDAGAWPAGAAPWAHMKRTSPAEVLPPREPRSGRIHVLIDTPAGSRNKYRYDAELGVFRISRVLPLGMEFPHDFGSIPQTRAADGDPLDVMVLGQAPSFPGCLVTVRLLGVLHAQQREAGRTIRNDRLIAAGETTVNRASLRELRELDPQHLRDIEHFFESYNRRQGREFRIIGRGGSGAARTMLERGLRAFTRWRGA
jgi:inorganic pyrophosphatase